jgi:transposase
MADKDAARSGRQSRRRFSREFKVEAVRLASAGDRSVAEVARELGMNAEVLRSWKRPRKRRMNSGDGAPVADVFPGNGKLTSEDEELRRLCRENAILREERAILKKRRPSLRSSAGNRDEIQLHQRPRERVHGTFDMPSAQGVEAGVLRVDGAQGR